MALTDATLQRMRERAAGYDRENTFPDEDLADLRAAGYLKPRPLAEVLRDQRRLAAYAPATALAINMHLVWVGVARVLAERGDESLRWVLDAADAGEVFAFGISEAGNDSVLWDSRTRADRVDGGYAFTGTKIFTSLAPAWTWLGVFGRQDAGDGTEDGPRLVHGFVHRAEPGVDPEGVTTLDDWNPLGMRASQSRSTVLDGAVVPDERVSRFLPVGPNADPFIFGIFTNFLLGIAAVYAGIGDRALELAVEAVQRRRSQRTGRPYAENPDLRWRIADMALALDPIAPELEALAADVDGLADRGDRWFRDLVGAKHRATETARTVVDQALRCAGGAGYTATTELSRLQRDVLAGIYHPSDTESVHETVAAALLGPLPS